MGRVFDPIGTERAKAELPMITYCEDACSCAQEAGAIVTVTEWVQFVRLIGKRCSAATYRMTG